ncbi:putative selection and upkeep of intraepithelial T-cells protein 1 homolog [Salvelinus sp. IW2-2015]|uniref:putative selection and upkeep of intraepithelial T-cells protein 1 homolog n=1 Tax=Salvelinus sp. IW2-2015 TaxID=2691554 RepID=UPI0038D4D76F
MVSLTGGLERGNVSLTLEKVTLEDRKYLCRVSNSQWYEKASVFLTVNGALVPVRELQQTCLVVQRSQDPGGPCGPPVQGQGVSNWGDRGNVSLTLERVTLEDRGEYVCHVSNERWYEKAHVYLSMNVTGSAPVLSVTSGGGGQMNVTCSSEGWSPQPKLTWRNKEEAEIKNEQVLFTSDSQGLLSVSSWLLYPPSDSDWLSCTISLSEEEKRESRVLPHKPGAWKEAFIVTLVLSLLLLCALSTVVCILLKHRGSCTLFSSQKIKNHRDYQNKLEQSKSGKLTVSY